MPHTAADEDNALSHSEHEVLLPYQKTACELLQEVRDTPQQIRSSLVQRLAAVGREQQTIAAEARDIRSKTGNDTLVVRASLEFSNYCRKKCSFCGMTAENKQLIRYRLTTEMIEPILGHLLTFNIRNLHLASGEDIKYDSLALSDIIRKAVHNQMDVALVTGQRKLSEYATWLTAGAKRYVLKFETSNLRLFSEARTGTLLEQRIAHLLYLRVLGFKIGTGIICGLPGQTLTDLANDLLLISKLRPDMASVSRFLPNDESRLALEQEGSYDTTLNFISLLRIILPTPSLRIPAGTTLGRKQVDALNHGANVVSLHVTPALYASLYSADQIKERHLTDMEDLRELASNSGMSMSFHVT